MTSRHNRDAYLAPPPGLLGEAAKFFYDAAPMPIPEVALAGAIGLFSGILGRCCNVSGTGLNQYVLLIAPTGVGKEGSRSGPRKLMKAIRKDVPAAVDFIGPSFASAQALRKRLTRTSSFVSHMGEFGYRLQLVARPDAPQYMVELRSQFLDLYNQSGDSDYADALEYANAEKNAAD